MTTTHDKALLLSQKIRQAQSLVVMTGAGASAESGIPTFRDALTGHWEKYSPTELATPEAFATQPERVTKWYDERRLQVLACDPNPGHFALAKIEQIRQELGLPTLILTQNVDELHQRAGSKEVVELHGSIVSWRCTQTSKSQRFLEATPFDTFPPPSPFHPEGVLRPGVVWFHEALPRDALDRAYKAMEEVDLYLVVGTSGVVYPAAGFLQVAREMGAYSAIVNPGSTPQDGLVDLHVGESSGTFLHQVANLIE